MQWGRCSSSANQCYSPITEQDCVLLYNIKPHSSKTDETKWNEKEGFNQPEGLLFWRRDLRRALASKNQNRCGAERAVLLHGHRPCFTPLTTNHSSPRDQMIHLWFFFFPLVTEIISEIQEIPAIRETFNNWHSSSIVPVLLLIQMSLSKQTVDVFPTATVSGTCHCKL